MCRQESVYIKYTSIYGVLVSKILGILLIFFFLLSAVSADEITYLIHTHSDSGALLQGAAYTDSDKWEVDGYIMLEHDSRAEFTGMWTRFGKIEAVDSDGNMYVFDVIGELSDSKILSMY